MLSLPLSLPGIRDMSDARPTPELDSVRDQLLWIRQPLMMSGASGVERSLIALERVLRDPHAFAK